MQKPPTEVEAAAEWLKWNREKRGWSTTEMAERARALANKDGDPIKLAQQLISSFEQPGAAKRIPQWLKYAARAFELDDAGAPSSDIIETGGELDYVPIDVMPSYAGAGGGGTGDGDHVVARMPRRLIQEELRGQAHDFILIDVRGDSMEPDFQHGDQILVDKRDRDPRQPGPFALWDDDGYGIKLVERIPQRRGWYRVFSANARYSAYEVEETESTIMGRPVWFARRL